MRVLVIGGTRFIGPYVVGQLVEEGHEVAVFNRGETETVLPEGVRRVRGDRRNLAGFADEFRRYAPDVVLDMIPMNEREARDVVSVFEGIARRVVAISSGDVYRAYDRVTGRDPGPPDPVPLDEDAPLRGSSTRTRAKGTNSTRRYWSRRWSWVPGCPVRSFGSPCGIRLR